MEGRVYERGSGSGAGRIVLVPKRFVWPHGGRKVSLSGSFTRWYASIPMSPMEGCPNVFQVICGLPPGHHQYKFNVDGEWRHDEQQPFVSGNYGVVNTIYLVREPDISPAILSAERPGSADMEVDNYGHVDADPRISESDLQVSRHRLSIFLSTHTAYELLPESGKVIALDTSLPLMDAFHILYEQSIQCSSLGFLQDSVCWSAKRNGLHSTTERDFEEKYIWEGPFGISLMLWSSDKMSSGSSILDIKLSPVIGVPTSQTILHPPVGFLPQSWNCPSHDELISGSCHVSPYWHAKGSNLSVDQLETHTIAAWKEGKLQPCGMDSNERTYPQSFVHAGPNECLKDVTMKILQNKVATVPIIHSSPEDGSSPQLLHLASLTGILKCICRHFKHNSTSLPILQLPISSIPLGTWMPKIGESDKQPLAMLKPNASLGAALSLLIQAKVSSIPIVDDNGALLDIYSRSDIIALVKDKAYAGMNLDEFSIEQALVLGQDANSLYGLLRSQRFHICLRSDSLHLVMEQLANNEVRRLVVVEAGSKRMEGIISIGDVFRFLLG
ncbi:hypothetical protein RIF29_22062 [Crotalaria pallida]|uniref:CBS domain-containing protein n=1 Tax=Crotalaria pallida TaxID=3830 RepID=A0AAN9F3Y3_CROPI